jgi:hypothetical protein
MDAIKAKNIMAKLHSQFRLRAVIPDPRNDTLPHRQIVIAIIDFMRQTSRIGPKPNIGSRGGLIMLVKPKLRGRS